MEVLIKENMGSLESIYWCSLVDLSWICSWRMVGRVLNHPKLTEELVQKSWKKDLKKVQYIRSTEKEKGNNGWRRPIGLNEELGFYLTDKGKQQLENFKQRSKMCILKIYFSLMIYVIYAENCIKLTCRIWWVFMKWNAYNHYPRQQNTHCQTTLISSWNLPSLYNPFPSPSGNLLTWLLWYSCIFLN